MLKKHTQNEAMGRREMARFLLLVPLGMQIPALIAWRLTLHIQVVRRGNSDFGYLNEHWHFAWIALALYLLWILTVWMGSPKLRALVAWDLRNHKQFRESVRQAGDICKLPVPSPADQELHVWSGEYRAKKKVATAAYCGLERRKQA